ncbi:hypothetical protein C0J52_22665 [Blattella germanica]|nr:hypothetical protein C0J52_22665 [Blattella germanica]
MKHQVLQIECDILQYLHLHVLATCLYMWKFKWTYAEQHCGLRGFGSMLRAKMAFDGPWFPSGITTLSTRYLVAVRRATLRTRGFVSMWRAEMTFDGSWLSSGTTNEIFGSCTQSYTVDSGIRQHVEGRDGIDGLWFSADTTHQIFGSCMQSCTVDLGIWRFGSMSRMDGWMDGWMDGLWFSHQIFGSCMQSCTVDLGIWQHVEDGWIVVFVRNYQRDVWYT